jgi:CRP/FNR family transcriptional regulator, cyclic AMP receptor protein
MAASPDENAPSWSLPAEYLKALAEMGTPRTYPKNCVLISEGERSDSLFIVLSGKVKVYLADEAGKELLLGTHGPGEYFGEMILDEGPRSASVMTLEACKFAVVTTDQFKQFLTEQPALSIELIKSLIHRVRALTKTVGNLGLLDVYGRVARLLLDLAVDQDGKQVIDERMTQQDMASRVGCSREMISRILKDLRVGGYIKMDGTRMIIARKPPSAW